MTSNRTAVVPRPQDDQADMEKDNTPSLRSNATKRPRDSATEHAPPPRGARLASQVENVLAHDAAAFRGRFRIVHHGNWSATGPTPHMPTPEDIETAFREAVGGWPACEESPSGAPRLASKNPFTRPSSEAVAPIAFSFVVPMARFLRPLRSLVRGGHLNEIFARRMGKAKWKPLAKDPFRQ